ncbi:MAG: S1 family peptidase [Actinomycetota bacterium]|nr:S1 family peptidase [Actinomycetota bacterium]
MRTPRVVLALLAAAAVLVTPATTATAGVDTGTVGTEPSYVELKAPQPDWYTPELHAEVLAAAERGEGVPIPEGVDYPASGLAFTGIRPGAWIISPAGCTTNFVFGSARDYYIGTAGHCTEVGDQVTLIAAPGILMNIGKTVKSVDRGVGNDFALIDVRPSMEQFVNPSMTYFGGPTAAGSPRPGDVVEHAGHGLVIGTGGTPRAGVVVYRGNGDGGDAFAWVGAASPGDSGSAVRLANGEAAGDLTHLVVGGPYVPGDVAGTTIGRMLRIAGKPLATAPNLPDPTY